MFDIKRTEDQPPLKILRNLFVDACDRAGIAQVSDPALWEAADIFAFRVEKIFNGQVSFPQGTMIHLLPPSSSNRPG